MSLPVARKSNSSVFLAERAQIGATTNSLEPPQANDFLLLNAAQFGQFIFALMPYWYLDHFRAASSWLKSGQKST